MQRSRWYALNAPEETAGLRLGRRSSVLFSTDTLQVFSDSGVLDSELVLIAERGGGRLVAEAMHDGSEWRSACGGECRVGVTKVVESQSFDADGCARRKPYALAEVLAT